MFVPGISHALGKAGRVASSCSSSALGCDPPLPGIPAHLGWCHSHFIILMQISCSKFMLALAWMGADPKVRGNGAAVGPEISLSSEDSTEPAQAGRDSSAGT